MSKPPKLITSRWLMKSFISGILLCVVACAVLKADDKFKPPTIGEAPPPIELQSLLQAPDGTQATWDALKGKVVVLEFWATWCGPCVGAISHMNELTDAFKDKPVQFLAISDEDADTVKAFLEKKPIHGWVGLNTTKSMFKAYGAYGIPHTVVVGTDGKIAAITLPSLLETKNLENVLAGKEAGLPEIKPADPGIMAKVGEVPTDDNNEQPALFQFLIRPSKAQEHTRRGSSSKGPFAQMFGSTELGATIADLLPPIYGVSGPRLIVDSPMPDQRYDIFVKAPQTMYQQMQPLSKQVIETTFGLTSKRESRELECYTLSVKTPNAIGLKPTATPNASSVRAGVGKIEDINVKTNSLAGQLESIFKKPVVDETESKDRYDILVKWDQPDKDTPNTKGLIEALQEQLGLELTPAKRSIEIVVVTRDSTPGRSASNRIDESK